MARVFNTLGLAAALAVPHTGLAAPAATTIYNFGAGVSNDGANPSSGLIQDSNGNLCGPTAAGGVSTDGTVFELSPPASGTGEWTETILHSFPNGQDDGVRPQGRLLLGPGGVIYGTTNGGGGTNGAGTVFQLAPPANLGAWTLTTLYVFPQNKIGLGAAPTTGVLMDSSGALYGATPEQGAVKVSDVLPGMVYKLTPPATGQTAWAYNTLYSFPVAKGHTNSPVSSPIGDAAGNLFGTVQLASTGSSQGAIYELTPPSGGVGAWAQSIVLKLPPADGSPVGDLAMDANGALYGATTNTSGNNGVVFRASPPASGGTGWTLTVLYAFSTASKVTPAGGVAFGSAGQLYGNAHGGTGKQADGLTYRLTPPASGTGRWSYTTLAQFAFKPKGLGQLPIGTPLVSAAGPIYGVTQAGGTSGNGTAFTTTP
jgi:hypothetical protein